MVGAPGARAGSTAASATTPAAIAVEPRGGAFLFAREGINWAPIGGLLAADAAVGAGSVAGDSDWDASAPLGLSVSVGVSAYAPAALFAAAPGLRGARGGVIVANAPKGLPAGSSAGLRGAGLKRAALLVEPATVSALGDGFGASMSVGGAIGVIGAPGAGGGAGAVYATSGVEADCGLDIGRFLVRGASAHSGSALCGECARGPCRRGFFEEAGCTQSANRVCSPCTSHDIPCAGGQAVVKNCTAVSDRVCGVAFLATSASQYRVMPTTCAADGSCDVDTPRIGPTGGGRLEDYNMPWRTHAALVAAFYASGGGSGGWASAVGARSAWAAGAVAMVGGGGYDFCTWPGVVCDTSGFVIAVRLPGAGLRGSISSWLDGRALPRLVELDFTGNGAISTWCGEGDEISCPLNLPLALTTIKVRGTSLGGVLVPSYILALPNLTILEVDGQERYE